ncbi:MAG TPA: glycosyltransferase, partial [Candidatus Angelobacter sp.]|nr:glycosyltransferase [Candidatus Angelobacter sp.]
MREFAGRILMLVENNYPQDTRVRNEASLLASSGYRVSVICLRKPGQPRTETIGNVRVYRLPRLELFKKTPALNPGLVSALFLKIKSFLGYLVEYVYFTTACFLAAAYILVRHGFDAIHAHNPPDTLFLAALPFKLLGKKFVFDHHDLCPELYMSRYRATPSVFTVLLGISEWCSLKLADVTIATNQSYKQVQIARGKRAPETIFVVRNGPDKLRMTQAVPSPRLKTRN